MADISSEHQTRPSSSAYAISAAQVRYGKDKGFMGGTLFALVAYFNSTERLSQQLRRRSSIHGLHGSMSSQTAIVGDPPPTLCATLAPRTMKRRPQSDTSRSGSTTGSSNLDSLQRGTTPKSSAVAQWPHIHLQGCRGVVIKDWLRRLQEASQALPRKHHLGTAWTRTSGAWRTLSGRRLASLSCPTLERTARTMRSFY
jgi:hypothetical protein